MYNPFWNKTLTIFTPLITEEKTIWYKYIKQNVFFKNDGYKTSGSNYSENNTCTIRIPCKDFLEYEEWVYSDKISTFSISYESLLIPKLVDDNIADNTSGTEIFDKYKCIKPKRITNNSYNYSSHILIIGE